MTDTPADDYPAVKDLMTERTREGDPAPVEGSIVIDGEERPTKNRQMDYGDTIEYGIEDNMDLSPEDLASLFSEKYVKPDLSDCTAEDLKKMQPAMPSKLLMNLASTSNTNIEATPNDDGGVHVEVDKGNR
jgi:hypothetical protein